MSLETSHYYSLTCNARLDNLVTPTCTTRSPGRWHDSELLEKEMLDLGWVKNPNGKGHLCPPHAPTVQPDEPEKPKRQSRAKAEVHPEPAWDGGGQ